MEDIRIMYLKCVHEQRVANSAAATAAFTYVAVVGLTTEKCAEDSHEIKLWLTGVLVMSAFQIVVKIVQSKLALPGSGATRSDMLKLARCNETLDIISSCWFIVGHFLLLETYRRRHQYPFMYFLCWQYILSCYLSWTVHHLVEFSLHVFPPFSLEDQHYWRRLQAAVDGDVSHLPEYLSGGGKDEVRFWTQWLQSYGCYDVCHPTTATTSQCTPPVPARRAQPSVEQTEADLMQQEDMRGRMEEPTDRVVQQNHSSRSQQAQACTGTCTTEEHEAESEVTEAVCSICLNSLTSPPDNSSDTASTSSSAKMKAVTSSRPADDVGDICDMAEDRVEATEIDGVVKTEKVGEVVVRYPCVSGRHLFHFDCLCAWMARASVRAVDIYGTPSLQPASCPCCRQPPCAELCAVTDSTAVC